MKTLALLLLLACPALASATASVAPSDVTAAPAPAPAGLERQALDVTQGEILRPAGWHYSWFSTQHAIIWTVSREDAGKGAYDTGMRIQFVPAVKASAGQTPEQVARGFLSGKAASAKVVRQCEEKPNGDFRLVCLETSEPSATPGKNFRILYSVSWSNERDWFVITTFGAPEAEWEALRPTIDAMSRFVLIGEGFGKAAQP